MRPRMRATHLPAGGAGTAGRRGPRLSWLESRREAERLRKAREDAGLRQRDLAALLGTGQMWVGFRETGKTLLTADEVTRIEQAIASVTRSGVTS
jgi:ribosome-binding protein aMBF1 (putative translation factor)